MTMRDLRPVPKEGESVNDFIHRESRMQEILDMSWSQDIRDLNAIQRRLERLRYMALRAKRYERASYLLTAIESIAEAVRCKT